MDSLTPTQRDRGLQRLRRLTFGATAGGLIAVVGVGYAAAVSYAGNASSKPHNRPSRAVFPNRCPEVLGQW